MNVAYDQESRAIQKLIHEIDSIEAYRNRIGRRIIYLFLGTFVFALWVLFHIALHERPDPTLKHPGPRVPGVLRDLKP